MNDYGIRYHECCRHCGEGCGAKDRHRFRCNACQGSTEDIPNGE